MSCRLCQSADHSHTIHIFYYPGVPVMKAYLSQPKERRKKIKRKCKFLSVNHRM